MIACYKGTSWVSRLIRWRDWSPYSHISWIEPDGTEYESCWPNGVQRMPKWGMNHTPGTEIDCFDVPLNEVEHAGLIDFLDSHVGKGYDFAAIFGFAARLPVQDKDKLFCSEYIFAAFQSIRISLLARVSAWKVPPAYFPLSPLLRPAGTMVVGPKSEDMNHD